MSLTVKVEKRPVGALDNEVETSLEDDPTHAQESPATIVARRPTGNQNAEV